MKIGARSRLMKYGFGLFGVILMLSAWHSTQEQIEQLRLLVSQKNGKSGDSTLSLVDGGNNFFGRVSEVLKQSGKVPLIYGITPTYNRPEQIPELTRLSQTLMQVPALHWVICEDSNMTSPQLQQFLNQLIVPHTFLYTPMPEKYKKDKNKPKGVAARNAGMAWLKKNKKHGVFYFMDDDNSYDIRLFSEMRHTTKVSMWPVGLVTHLALSAPILREGKHVGWYDGYDAGRKFPVDMAAFAVNIDFWISAGSPLMPFKSTFEEDGFLKALNISPFDIEFRAEGCTKIYVWHTRTSKASMAKRTILEPIYDKTNLRKLQESLVIEPITSKNINKTYVKEAEKMMNVKF